MATWHEVETQAPELAAQVRALLDPALGAAKHKTIATLRSDGSPRISGIECTFVEGELTFGSMPGARKAADLHRDPRFALHSATVDPPDDTPQRWPGEAKVAGLAVPTGPLPGDGPPGEGFRADLHEVVWTHLDASGEQLVVEHWHTGRGVERVVRG
ncbi:MAG: pyridoxamine 5'-phosphate oxidase family protein [Cellulomonas sp.]|nr:pyridoxamine 5'-phosphate oxidase family protein [Cellulomonas sp.]